MLIKSTTHTEAEVGRAAMSGSEIHVSLCGWDACERTLQTGQQYAVQASWKYRSTSTRHRPAHESYAGGIINFVTDMSRR